MRSALIGTGRLLRFALRRDRIQLPLWMAGWAA
jgi:putative exporter of polyketide antibiotics